MAKAKAGRVGSDITLRCVELAGTRRLQRDRAAGEVGPRLQDPRHLRGHPADPAADRRPPGARAVQRRAEVASGRSRPRSASTSSGSGRGPGRDDEHRADAALGQPGVAVALLGRPCPRGASRVRRRGGPAAQPLHPRPDVVAVAADDRQVEHGDRDLVAGRGRPRRSAGAARRACGPAPRGRTARCSRRRAGPRSRSVRRSPPPPTMTGISCDRPRVAGRLGQRDPLAVVRLGAGRPQRAHRLDRRLQRSSRSRGGGNGRPNAACSRSHQPAPTPTNARPPVSASSVATALAVMPGRPERHRRAPACRAAGRCRGRRAGPSVTHGSGIGSQARPTCGIWIRWSISASPAKPASSAAQRRSPRSQAGRVLAPREARDLQHDLEPCDGRGSPVGRRRGLRGVGAAARARRGRRTVRRRSQPSSSRLRGPSRNARSWSVEHRRRHGPVARRRCGAGTPRPGCRRRRRRRAARRPGAVQPARAPSGVQAERVHDGGQPAAEPGGDDRVEQGEGVGRRVQVVRGRCRPRRAGRRRRRPRRGGSARRPHGLARPRGADEDHERGIGQGARSDCGRRWSARVLERVVAGERPVEAGLVETADDHLVLLRVADALGEGEARWSGTSCRGRGRPSPTGRRAGSRSRRPSRRGRRRTRRRPAGRRRWCSSGCCQE